MGWYQDYAGNWFNEYDHDGIEYEDGPSDKVPSSDKETPLKKTKKNVSFEKADTQKEKKPSKSEKSPRERWQWAFSRIVQQNRVIKRLAKLEKERKQIVQPEKKKIEVIDDTPDRENLNNNVSPIKENVVIDINKTTEQEKKVIDTASKEAVTKDPFKLPLPADYEDYWYEADDGCWYNEYDDELEEGYYYASEATMDQTNASNTIASTISADTQSKSIQKGLPKPSDYEDYWYEGEDGMWYNEYDDELEEGQFYEDPNANDASSAAEEAKKKEEETKKAAESKRIAEEEAKKAQEEAARVAKEASKAAEDAAKAAKEASQNLMKGFSSMGGSMFGATK